jgi:phospholipid/cholesterol/gamma-HCH transport system substrate-binding protein
MGTRKGHIGFFVVGGLVLFGVGMFLIGDRHQVFARHAEYFSEFVNLAGLANGAKVRVAGMDAGQVVAIGVPDSPSSRFRVKWRIDEKLRGLVRTDSVATIGTEGVVGGTYLSVGPGSARAPQADALSTIPGKEPTELSELLAGGRGLLNDAQETLKDIGAKLGVTLDGLTATMSNVNDVVVGLKEGRGTAGMLLRDDGLAHDIREAVTTTASRVRNIVTDLEKGRGVAGMLLRDDSLAINVRDVIAHAQQATAHLGHASGEADALISDLNSRRIAQKAGEMVDNLSDSARQIHQVLSDVTRPDSQGMSAGTNVRESLTNANIAAANLAEATEALKHNFLTRGFFKKRGYYSLADMSPERYRQDGAFSSRTHRRVWFSGAELFQDGSNGEELSARGKTLLNAALMESGDSLVESPMVIEGYWNGDVPADQLRFSRSRAMAVRQYLQTHFQLDTRNLGIVPMKNSPPSGIGRATWDGICIVVLRRS